MKSLGTALDQGKIWQRAARQGTLWALAMLMAMGVFAQATPAAAATSARSADSFVESVGVNTHFYYSDTPYVEAFPLVKQRLSELGVRHIRENIAPDERPDQYRRLRELAAAEIKADLILGDPRNGISTLDHMLSVIKTELPGTLDAVEGPNEFNAQGVPNWITKLREYQQHLYTAVKSSPALSSLTVIGPSITSWQAANELGDISGMLDVGSVHPYTSKPPETVVNETLERSAQNAGSKPTFTTETGYDTAMNYTGPESFLPVSEAAQAVYAPRAFLENFRRGIARTYSYELLDEFPDPGLTDRESNFGLLRNDLSKKPAFDALQNLIAILKDPGSSFGPGSLDYSLGGNQENLRQLLLQKRDGSFYLVLWRATSVWNALSQTPLDPGAPTVSVSFRQPIAGVQLYSPDVSSAPRSSTANPTGPLNFEVGPQVQILRITPGEEASPEPTPELPAREEPPLLEPEPEPEPEPAPESEPTQSEPEPVPVESAPPLTEPEPSPSEETAPAPEGEGGKTHGHKSGGSSGGGSEKGGQKRLALWTNRGSIRAGQSVALHGRVIAAHSSQSTPVVIQSWHGRWRTVAHDHTSRSGFFGKRIRLSAGHKQRVARIRVVAPAVAPSPPVHVRILG